jgi:hypothetical protein
MFEIEPLTFPPLEEKEVVAAPDPNQQLGREEVEDVFKNYGITKWESAPGATELGGLRLQTVDAMISLKDSCGCNLTITGGAETQGNDTGLYTHASGNKFDVRTKDNPELVDYVSSLSKVEGTNNKYYDPKDPHVVYTLNRNNLDVTVIPLGSTIE